MPTPAVGVTAGWHVNLSGRLQPYPPCAQLVLEHAWERSLPEASVTVDGVGTFDVRFNAAGGAATGGAGTGPHLPVAVQLGRAQQRNVHRVPPSRARPEPPLLADARRVARITRADEVGEEWQLLAQAAAALEEARRCVASRRGEWVEGAKQWRALEGKKVAVVGSFLIGSRGVLHDVLVGAGGAIPTHAQPVEKKVNSQTDLLFVGGALTEQSAADAAAVSRALREVNSKRGGTKAKPPCQRLDEVGLASLLSAGDEGESSFAWSLGRMAAALELAQCRQLLLSLALQSEAWRATEAAAPLRGLSVCLTGVMCCAMGSDDTHAVVGGLVRRCGGAVAPSVTKGCVHTGTGLLIVGRGEKGEHGKPDGKGLRPESSSKYAAARRFNLSLAAEGKPPIAVLYEDKLVPFLLSSKARALVEAAAAMPAGARRGASAVREATRPPLHAPDLRAIRFTSIAQRAHGCGEPGGKGTLLADALSAPDGFTLGVALVAARSVDEQFAWTMLQTASVADGAPDDLAPEILLVQWGADPAHRTQAGRASPVSAAAPDAAAAAEGAAAEGAAAEGRASGGAAEGCEAQAEGKWLGQGCLEEGAVPGTRMQPEGAHPKLDELCKLRRKPRIRHAHCLTADTTVSHGHGQMHSKFWLLHFVSTQAERREARLRLVVTSGNATPGAFGGGGPDRRQLCGLWWADFDIASAAAAASASDDDGDGVDGADAPPPPPSAFRAALLHHVEAMLASKPHHGAGSAANRSAAEALWRRLRAAVERADTSTADEAGTTLIAHAPGTYLRRPAAEGLPGVPQGVDALRACWRATLHHPAERLDLAVIAHCASGWSAGGDGAQRFDAWCAAAAPNGGRVAFHWPQRGDSSILGTSRAAEPRTGYKNCELPKWVAALPMVRLRLRKDVIATGEHSGYQATPHLMLYVLHEPIAAEGDLPVVRRLLLTSANLSAAPWGYARGEQLEIRNFELGVSVVPERPSELVEPLGDLAPTGGAGRSLVAWAQAIPFDIGRRVPCDDPFLNKALLNKANGQAEQGHLNY